MSVRKLLRRLAGLAADRRASVALATAVAMPVTLGAAGVGIEVSNWFMTRRAMQNAADSAVLAAAQSVNGNYDAQAKAVAAQYGFLDGSNGVTVSAVTGPCPVTDTVGLGSCYTVTVTGSVPLYLTQLVGFTGDLRTNGQNRKRLSATATATQAVPYCILALDSVISDDAILANGSPKTDLGGCNVMSNASIRCNGSHGIGAGAVNAVGSSDAGCGDVAHGGVRQVADPYRALAANIPSNAPPCSSPQVTTSDQLFGNKSSIILYGATYTCGDLQLSRDIVIQQNPGGSPPVLVIRNGNLDLNGHTLRTDAGASVTVSFSGSNSYSHIPTGKGILDIAAPTSGPWAGIALYQDPALTNGVDVDLGGSQTSWYITGVVYMPNADTTFSGAVNKASNGQACVVFVVHSLRINGSAQILSNGSCPEANVNTPQSRGRLVN